MNGLFVITLLIELLALVPEYAVVPLPGSDRSFQIAVRNVSDFAIDDMRFDAACPFCDATVEPGRFDSLPPSDERVLMIHLRRTAKTGQRRFPLFIKIASKPFPDLEGLRLMVDSHPNAKGGRDGWIDVGAVKVETRPEGFRKWVIAVVGLVPLAGLLLFGWLIKRKASRPS